MAVLLLLSLLNLQECFAYFFHRIRQEQKGALSFEHPAPLLAHLADYLFLSLDSILDYDDSTQQQERFSSQEDALIAVRDMWE